LFIHLTPPNSYFEPDLRALLARASDAASWGLQLSGSCQEAKKRCLRAGDEACGRPMSARPELMSVRLDLSYK
jgi:hypothetical protein